MKRSEAETVFNWLVNGLNARADEDKRTVWVEELMLLPAAPASEVTMQMIRMPGARMPTIGDFRKAVRDYIERMRPKEKTESFASGSVPLWIKRWCAARWLHAQFGKEQDMRPFPEQKPYVDPGTDEWMPPDAWLEEAEQITDRQAWSTLRRLTV